MNHDKRLIIFIAAALFILLFFNHFFASKKPPSVNSTLSQPVQEEQEFQSFDKNLIVETKQAVVESRQTVDFDVGEYILSISPTGGYVSKIHSKKYKEDFLYKDMFISPTLADKEFALSRIPNGLEMRYSSDGVEVTKKITSFEPYVLTISMSMTGQGFSELQIFNTGLDKGYYSRYQEFFYGASQLSRIAFSKLKKTELISNPVILGARDRYYTVALMKLPKGDFLLSKQNESRLLTWKPDSPVHSIDISFFMGPQDITILKNYNIENIVNFGFFNVIGIFLLKTLHFFHNIFKSWGISIILISTLIYFVLFPLTAKSTKSIKKMQEIQPLVEDLRKKLKDSPQKLNKEVMSLYNEYKVNPLGGCLPMFLQIPIFFTLYQVLIRSVEIKGAKFLWIKDLSHPDYLITLPFSLPVIGNGLHILPIIMILIMFFQQKLTTPQAQSSEQQKMMTIFMPLIFGFIFYSFPAGLVLYWLCNSLYTFLYQLKITKIKS